MDTTPDHRLDAALLLARERIDVADAKLLLAHVLDKPQAWLFAHSQDQLDAPSLRRFDALVQARLAGTPMAYLTGRRGFWTLDLAVTPDTLIPRPETERLVELALARLPGGVAMRVADLGTGSGAIALAIASERPAAILVATDASQAALAVARDNARAHGLGNIEFRQGSWLQTLAGERYDLIVSNPPYIADGDPHLAALQHEPDLALTSGADGLDAIREIVAEAPSHLQPEGWLLLEHGWDQGAAVRALMQLAGFLEVTSAVDIEDRERVTLGRIS
ncbi:MAG: peptide chain release factor N(5)-glutamine methyltransferase [Pseudoxanthomonas sp.]